jgi:peptidoglycan/xylan/chitin deacetylase (PgdA/CDA1 family)
MSAVLLYHQIEPVPPQGDPTVTPEAFLWQLEHLRRTGWAFESLDSPSPTPRSLSVTFDDGFLSVLTHGVPALRKLSVPATFFIVAGAVGKTDTWHCGREGLLDWPHLRDLSGMGYAIGSHSLTHPSLDAVPLEVAREEIGASKKLLEDRLGVPVRHFAYPKGRYNPAVADLVRSAGYAAGWATKEGDRAPFTRRRIPIGGNAGPLRFRWRMRRVRWGLY